MAKQCGPAQHRKGKRSRPIYISKEAVWDVDRQCWLEGEFWFDEKTASAAVGFFKSHIKLTEGEWSGRPFVLEPWQENDIVRPLFGWKRADGTRRYRRCYVWVARKNGKTELAAGIALLMLLGDAEPAGQVYSMALDKDQASIVFDKSVSMVSKSPTLQDSLSTFKTSVYCATLNAAFKPLSGKAEGKHGFSASGLIGDEIHEWKSGDLYQFIHDSEGARRQPLEFLISTAGKKGTYAEEVYEECLKINEGLIDDPETLVVIYAAEPEDDWSDPKTWLKANPNLGVSKKLETMQSLCREARQKPRLENGFKNYHLNIWTDSATLWLPLNSSDDEGNKFGWDHCKGPIDWRLLEARLKGLTCFGGLDLSSINDLSALVWFFPTQDGLETPVLLPRFFKPKDHLKAHGKRDRLNYERWAEQGALSATPGNVVDYAFIKDQIYRDGEQFQIAHAGSHKLEQGQGGLAIDRWNATQIAVELQQEELPVVLFGQGFFSMSAPSKELERLVLCNGLHHGGHPLLREHVKVVAVEENPAGDIKPAKNKSTKRIDGVVASVMGIGIAANFEKGDQVDLDEMLEDPVMVI